MVRPSCVVVLLVALAGCENGAVRQQLDQAQSTVQTSLDAWRRGETPATLLAQSPPIEFFDEDWNLAAKLVEFAVRKTYLETDGTPRCAVELVVQSGGRSPERIHVTYQVVMKEQRLVVARDPFS